MNGWNLKNNLKKICSCIFSKIIIRDSPNSFADSSSVSQDEKQYYKPDSYYTYYVNPGTNYSKKVITFEERKKISFSSANGLYVAEILLLEYCKNGKYPKPEQGYPGFWWFQYGIRDVGHVLDSLYSRGFIKWSTKKHLVNYLSLNDLKQILSNQNIKTSGNKSELIDRINQNLKEDQITYQAYTPKYELTDLGENELNQNGYVPYMHKHHLSTIESDDFGEQFNVWSVNKKFINGNASNWQQIVRKLEKEKFGTVFLDEEDDSDEKHKITQQDTDNLKKYLVSKQKVISDGISSNKDIYSEQFVRNSGQTDNKDAEELVHLYICIGKKTDIPYTYRRAAIILRKYHMYDEELKVVESGISNIPKDNHHRDELIYRRDRVLSLIEKNKK